MEKKICEESFLVSQRGFTLIELLVVMVIIGMLASLVGPRIFKRLEKAKWQGAEGQRHLFDMALDTYRLDVGHYPQSLEGLIRSDGESGWDGPYLKKDQIPKDPWGGEWNYQIGSDDNYILTHSKSDTEAGQGKEEIGQNNIGKGHIVPVGESSLGITDNFHAIYS